MKEFVFNKVDFILEIDGSRGLNNIPKIIQNSLGDYFAYHLYNLPKIDSKTFYEELAGALGTVRSCHPINDKSKKYSNSRDIRPDPSLYHFYASNTRQPLHTDGAYYPEESAPEWLMLYCLIPSTYGGKTHILTVKTLIDILLKFKPDLMEKLGVEVVWSYTGIDGDVVHSKPILKDGQINWNYWQIKPELNTPEVIEIRDEFFKFLEDIIVDGGIYDFSKSWKKGDALIINDKYSLHGRDAFLGDRWLKDHIVLCNEHPK